jgi:hypothetical protein
VVLSVLPFRTFAVNSLHLLVFRGVHGTLPTVRWARLFDDLGGQLEAAEQAERAAEAADLRRLEVSRVGFADRLAGAAGTTVTVGVEGVGALTCVVGQVGAGWALVQAATGTETLVALSAVVSVTDLPAATAPGDVLDPGLALGFVLRRLARDRLTVTVITRTGEAFTGTIDRVGADFLDVAEHAADRPRRADDVQRVRTVPFATVAVVRPA